MKKFIYNELPILFVLLLATLFVYVVKAHGSNYQEVKAQCTSMEFTRLNCKLRTTDNKVYFNGKWRDEYAIVGTIRVDDELNLLLDKKELER